MFLSVPNAEALGIYEGPGTPLPFCAEVFYLPPRHAALAPMGLAAASRFIGVSPCPRGLGAPDGALADMARTERA